MRTRLLVMLAVLSLPLLIISLVQLHSYQRSLWDHAHTAARVESASAARALEEWAERNPEVASTSAPPDRAAAGSLYGHLRRHVSQNSSVVVFDSSGAAVPDSSGAGDAPSLARAQAGASVVETPWSDGGTRVTSFERAGPSGWTVATGTPLAEDTPAGRAILLLTATWALTLVASSLLAWWAVGRFTKPLRSLTAAAAELGAGNLERRARVETEDEVGVLAGSFNQMAASLQEKFEELRRQGAFIGEVLDSLPIGVAVLDSGLVVRKVNAAFARFAGRDAEALTGRGVYEAAAGLAVLSEVVEDVRRTRRPFVNYGQPLDLVARDGEARDAQQKYWDLILWPTTEQTGSAGSLILILSEVSKRVRAEKLASNAFAAEKARAAELESVINQMDEGVVIVDARGRYRVNPAGRRILGREPAEFRDGIEALVADMGLRRADGEPLAECDAPIRRAYERGEHVAAQRLTIVRGDGEERVLAVGATPLPGDGGRREGAASVFRDITEEVRRHEELVSAYDRLRDHDRLKSAFVANMSHELRTPLNVIIGLSQILRRDQQAPLAPLQSDAVQRVERNARALLELVNDMLNYSRLESGRTALKIESVNVAEVVESAVEEHAAEVREKKLKVRVEVSPELGAIRSDRQKLKQVLSVLISNATKFTSSGTVVVSAAPVDEARWYVEVSDTGIGMSSDALTYIFDGFRQVDDRLARSYSGVGLGLAIARKIVELLDGEITVESRPGEGSRFRITWPREALARTGTGSLATGEAGAVAAIADWRARHVR